MSDPLARPKKNTDEIRQKVAKEFAPKVLEWEQDSGFDLEKTERDLFDLFSSPYDDGYQLARRFEDQFHASPDTELVEIFDTVTQCFYKHHKDAQIEWWKTAKDNAKTFPAGHKVIYNRNPDWEHGVIVEKKDDSPDYGVAYVAFPSKGQVPGKYGHYLVEWESLRDCCQTCGGTHPKGCCAQDGKD